MSPAYLFVYGTLRRGSRNPHALMLEAESRMVGEARMHGRLYDLGRYPAAVLSNVASDWVQGELLRLDRPEELLAKLDAYEGPQYARVPQKIYGASGTRLAWVYVFRGARKPGRRIASGEWKVK